MPVSQLMVQDEEEDLAPAPTTLIYMAQLVKNLPAMQ